jgi:hypothetical protein
MPDQAPWPLAPLDPSAPVRPGVLVNPQARGLRAEGARRALRQAAPGLPWEETPSVKDIGAAVGRLWQAGVNVLAVAGGDGALHFVLQELLRHGRRWPGVLMALQGGTLNIVARHVGPAAAPGQQLASLLRQTTALGALAPRSLPLLRVEGASTPARHGFIFGSEAVKNALEIYDDLGGGYGGLARFLFEVGRGYALNTPLWQRERWRLDPLPFGLQVRDASGERSIPAYSAAIASTLDLAIAGGAIRTLRRRPEHRGFFARIITETRVGPLLRMIPALMRGGSIPSVVDAPEATGLSLRGAFTLDGECFGASSRYPEVPDTLRVEEGGSVAVL